MTSLVKRLALLSLTLPVVLGGMALASGQFARYYAVCAQHNPAWTGPYRPSYAEAQTDALNHQRHNPGHSADVLSGIP